MCTFSHLFFQVKGPLSVPLKDVAGHSQHLTSERFTSGHTQAKGLITVQSQDVGELLPVQLIIRITWEYTQVWVIYCILKCSLLGRGCAILVCNVLVCCNWILWWFYDLAWYFCLGLFSPQLRILRQLDFPSCWQGRIILVWIQSYLNWTLGWILNVSLVLVSLVSCLLNKYQLRTNLSLTFAHWYESPFHPSCIFLAAGTVVRTSVFTDWMWKHLSNLIFRVSEQK